MVKQYFIVLTVFLLCFQNIQAQDGQGVKVSGTVTDRKTGEPLAGVSIIIKGTTKGTISDIDGNYFITVPDTSAILEFGFIGYEKKEVKAPLNGILIISLEEESKKLEEVVVTALNIKRSKKELGYSLQEVNGGELKGSGELNVVNSLNAKVAGAQINASSGSPAPQAEFV